MAPQKGGAESVRLLKTALWKGKEGLKDPPDILLQAGSVTYCTHQQGDPPPIFKVQMGAACTVKHGAAD